MFTHGRIVVYTHWRRFAWEHQDGTLLFLYRILLLVLVYQIECGEEYYGTG
jgi:hypothetical protein